MMRPSMEKALSEDVEVAGKELWAFQNRASSEKDFWFDRHQSMGFSFRDRVPLSFRNRSSSAFSLPRTESTIKLSKALVQMTTMFHMA